MLRAGNVAIQTFGNVQCPILRIKTNSTPQCWCGLTTDILEKSRLNWKLKIRNVDITQSQSHNTRHRRVHEVNSLCTDSWPKEMWKKIEIWQSDSRSKSEQFLTGNVNVFINKTRLRIRHFGVTLHCPLQQWRCGAANDFCSVQRNNDS